MAGIYEGASSFLVFSTTTQTWVSKIKEIEETGRSRKALDTTVLTDTDHQYIPSNVNEPGMLQVKAHFDSQNFDNATSPVFAAIETIKIVFPSTATGTYTATSNRPSMSCAGFVEKFDVKNIKIESLIEVDVTIKLSGARTVSTGAA